jgi:phage baseplate assembly protein W
MASTVGVSIPIDANGDMIIRSVIGEVLNAETAVLEQGVVRQYTPYISGKEEVKQAITIRLLTRLGEDVLEPSMGLPIRSMILVNDDEYIRGAIRSCVLREPRVADVGQIDLERDPVTRQCKVSFTVQLRDTTNLRIEEVFQL